MTVKYTAQHWDPILSAFNPFSLALTVTPALTPHCLHQLSAPYHLHSTVYTDCLCPTIYTLLSTPTAFNLPSILYCSKKIDSSGDQ